MGAMKAALEITLSASKNLKPVVATAWQYAKVEMIPPLTADIFQGSLGKKIENAASGAADNFIAGIDQKLKAIEAERVRVIKEKEAAINAAAQKAKAEALKKAEEQKRVEKEKAAAAAKAQKAKEEAAKTANKQEPSKTVTTSEAKVESKDKPKRVAPKTKKKAKTSRREVKKGSAPKQKK